MQQIGSALPSLSLASLAVDQTWGYQIAPPVPNCCSDIGPGWVPDSFDLSVDDIGLGDIDATDSCNDQVINISGLFGDWGSDNTAVALVTKQKVQGVGPGATFGTTQGEVPQGAGAYCPNQLVQERAPITVEDVPSGEITEFSGTLLITQGQYLMTLEPGTPSYDNHSVAESSPVLGTNSCWWSTSGMVQYPKVQGSTWVVDQGGDAGHNQYGLDTVGFESGVVNLIQSKGAAHGVEFPCVINIYQLMNYDGIDPYVTNLQSQTVGSNTVTVCRAGVCSGTIPF